ncbi:MAG: hypothetical protein ACRDLB_15020 [Actinomycetota bacterium]
MKKTLVSLVGLALAFSVVPALAGPTKGSFSAQLLPFPKLAAVGDPAGITEPGCLAGQEDVHWTAEAFKAPKKGTLEATSAGFTGDFDLYLLDDAGVPLVRSENDQTLDQAPPEESVAMPLAKGQAVQIAVCNWLGAPDVTVDWVFKATKKKR